MTTLDMRGQPCPIPVIEAKKVLASSSGALVLVDNAIAVQNLQKMANGLGCAFSYEQRGEADFAVTIVTNGQTASAAASPAQPPATSVQPMPSQAAGATVLITADSMGRGSEELGKILIKGFIYALTQLPEKPEAVLFLNGGVHLAAEGSNTVEDLKVLAQSGVVVRACGTCLNYYGLIDKLAVGEVADMMEIAERITGANKTVML